MQRLDLDTTDSTNAEARRLLVENLATPALPGAHRIDPHEPFALVAREQTGGRGRLGREWSSPPGGVWLTVVWPMRRGPTAYGAAPLIAAAVASRAVERALGDDAASHRVEVKWPNDILLNGRKVCGILCETVLPTRGTPAMLIGIGINAAFDASLLPSDARFPPTTIAAELGRPVDAEALTADIMDLIRGPLCELERDGLAHHVIEELRARLAWVGDEVSLDVAGRPHVGVLRGLAEDGRMLLEVKGEVFSVASGEISTLRRQAVAS